MRNNDNRCFGYAILSALYPLPVNAQRAHRYIMHFSENVLDQITYPVEPTEVTVIEEQLNLKINIFPFMITVERRVTPYIFRSVRTIKTISIYYIGIGTMHGSKGSQHFSTI